MRYPVGRDESDYKKNWYIASGFGARRSGYYHNGVDLNLKSGGDTDLGQPLYAVADGKIVYYHKAKHPRYGYGWHMVLEVDTPIGKRWFHYAHCSEIVTRVLDVKKGEIIGKIGKTGNSPSAHLHFACFKVDPATLPRGIDTIAKTKQQLYDWWEDPIKIIENNASYDDKTYRGLDLTNTESMKVAVDIWYKYRVTEEIIDRNKYDNLKRKYELLKDEFDKYKEEVEKMKKSWEEITENRDINDDKKKTQMKELKEQIEKIAAKLNVAPRIEVILAEIESLLGYDTKNQKLQTKIAKLENQIKEEQEELKKFVDTTIAKLEDLQPEAWLELKREKKIQDAHIESIDTKKTLVIKAIMGLSREGVTCKEEKDQLKKQLDAKIEELNKLLREKNMKRVISHKYSLNKHDLIKIGHGALLASTGALALYVAQVLGQVDFGDAWWSPLAVAFVPVVVNALRKWASTNVYMVK